MVDRRGAIYLATADPFRVLALAFAPEFDWLSQGDFLTL